MKPFTLLVVGVVVGWAASGVDWTCSAEGDELSNDLVASAASPNPADALEVPASDNPRRPRQWPRRVFETRMAKDANGNLHPITESRLVNADGSIYPETPVAQQPPYAPPANDQINATAMSRLPAPIRAGLVGRFQASAYGSPSGHGCYVIDTMTGRTWHVANGQPPQVVACVGAQPAVTSDPAYVPTPSMNHPEPMVTPPPSYTESMPGLGTVNRPATQRNVVPVPTPTQPSTTEPAPDAAD